MCGIDNDNIYVSLNKCIHTSKYISCDTNCRTAEKTYLCILGCKRIFNLFLDILDGNESF